jgi:hypothetical protein
MKLGPAPGYDTTAITLEVARTNGNQYAGNVDYDDNDIEALGALYLSYAGSGLYWEDYSGTTERQARLDERPGDSTRFAWWFQNSFGDVSPTWDPQWQGLDLIGDSENPILRVVGHKSPYTQGVDSFCRPKRVRYPRGLFHGHKYWRDGV